MAAAALLSTLGAWGMLAETDLAPHWLRWVLPKANSHNAVGVVRPSGTVRRRAVLCAHLDTHRTPVFYSSRSWNRLFGLLVAGAFLSMAVEAAGFGLGALFGWEPARWIGLAVAPMELFALGLCLHADLTPFSPGANDNASGVGVILGVAQRLASEPLSQTETWLAFTACEEVGTYGMAAFLDAHAAGLGGDAVYIILDQVGIGRLGYLTADGLIRKHKTHPIALEMARRVTSALPRLQVRSHAGLAYTDALAATKRGLIALTLNTLPPAGTELSDHWHQMTDKPEHIDPKSLADAHAFAWQLLQDIDRT
jgi:hypothetical protein